MDSQEMLLLGFLLVLLAIMCVYYAKSQKRIRKLLFGALSGVILLFPVQLILSGLGYAITINLFTVTTAAILGIPGTILLTVAALL